MIITVPQPVLPVQSQSMIGSTAQSAVIPAIALTTPAGASEAALATVGAAVVAGGLGHRSRGAAVIGGAAALAASACTRFGIFHAGVASAEDPKYTVVPQRERLAQQG